MPPAYAGARRNLTTLDSLPVPCPVLVTAAYTNRELSLLDFQERVLALAESDRLPLLERSKFLAIVSQNIDEFFQVRVAGLKEQLKSGVGTAGPDGIHPRELIDIIRDQCDAITQRMDNVWAKEVRPGLAAEGIVVADWVELNETDKAHLGEVFDRDIFPVLTPLAVDPSHPFPYISNLSMNLAVVVHDSDRSSTRFARVKVPQILDRFVQVGDGHTFVPLEQVIAAHVDRLFPGRQIVAHYIFRVTRNADLAVEEEEAGDLLEAMESVLLFRQRFAAAVRLEVGPDMTDHVSNLLTSQLQLEPRDVYRSESLLGLDALWGLHALDRPELKAPVWTPVTPQRLGGGTGDVDMFEVIRNGDVFVHHPYESFATSTGAFLAQAATDPDVLAIKQTLYRTSIPADPALGGEEAIVRSLIEASQAGKQVVVLVELKARFDEEANIQWARMLEAAGVHVVYGVTGLKTHSKILLVVRRESDGIRRYAHIGTGNYNPNTARIYEDLGLYTADPLIGADLSLLFNELTGFSQGANYNRLLVAPASLRTRITERIRDEAAKGSDGHIVMKANHLVDSDIIDELYAAAQAGCRVDLIIRGICCLRPGALPGTGDIQVRSIVGRFLEHSRVYRFGKVGQAVYYIGSADMMPRNLDGRVEALVPVVDPRLQQRLEEILHVCLEDDVLAWELGTDGDWTRAENLRNINAHDTLQAMALDRVGRE